MEFYVPVLISPIHILMTNLTPAGTIHPQTSVTPSPPTPMDMTSQEDQGQVFHHIMHRINDLEGRLVATNAAILAASTTTPTPCPRTLQHHAPIFSSAVDSCQNPLDFAAQLRLALELEHVPVSDGGRHFSASLVGLAQVWFHQWRCGMGYSKHAHLMWEQYVMAFQAQYCLPTQITDLRNSLNRVRYSGKIITLQANFGLLSLQIPDNEMTVQDQI